MKSINPGMQARMIDGVMAMVSDVLIDRASHTAQYVVLSANGYFGRDVLAPISAVWRVDTAVHLVLSSEEVAALPYFDHFTHCGAMGLCSRSAWRYGALRPAAPGARVISGLRLRQTHDDERRVGGNEQ